MGAGACLLRGEPDCAGHERIASILLNGSVCRWAGKHESSKLYLLGAGTLAGVSVEEN